MTQNATRVVSIASGKGGVGKTSAAVNLAFALAALGRKVCILDADLGLSNVDILLGISTDVTLEDVLFNGLPMEKAIIPVGRRVDLISGNSGVSRMAELSKDKRRRLIREFKKLTDYDYLIIDNSPGISIQIVSICLSSMETVVVVNPESASVIDSYALIKVMQQNGLTRGPFLLINKVKTPAQARVVFQKLNAATQKYLKLNLRHLGDIPADPEMSNAAEMQRPVLETASNSLAARSFMLAAGTLDKKFTPYKGKDPTPVRFWEHSVMRSLQHPATADRPQDQPPPQTPKLSSETMFILNRLARDLDEIFILLEGLEKEQKPAERKARIEALRSTVIRAKQTIIAESPTGPALNFQPGPGKPPAQPQPPPRPRAEEDVLLVCPYRPLNEILTEILKDKGLKVAEYKSSREGDVPAFNGYRLGLVCWDAPDTQIQNLVKQANGTPIILLKGYRHGTDGETEYRDNVAVLEKPFRVENLVKTIERFIG